ncbi:alpha/beta hydrolase [Microbacterium sp. zg-Y818]|uniref:alpha/beta fold hydrolase n=1 Tax=unclassified Microbacterium TaxID=2609290 RepID=UPI00214C348C|nr:MULTISPECIES: alpha/beta hydrolase [unclassified Microbacterium]MCR2799374.1 alpha/beta fold hydrolase [Microbacterium sp. zg.Y818]WIM21373.1 alpha/beta hydrolase [Microbacterium sp. zg-Y818]
MTGAAATFEATSRSLEGDEAIHYHVFGDGPALLLLHGSGPGVSAWGNFGELLETIGAQHRIIAPDLPGYGSSYIPELDGDYALTAIAAIRRVLEAESVDRVHVLGNSLGGMIAFRLTLEHPELVDRIVAMGPGGATFPLFGPQPTEGIRRLVEFTTQPTRERLIAWMHSMVGDPSFVTEERVQARWEMASTPEALAFTRSFYAAAMRSMAKGAPTVPLWARLGEIGNDVLLVYGRDDRVTPLESAFLPLRLLRRSELHVIANTGHWVMLERPDAFAGVVCEFLGRRSAASAR